MDLQDWKRPRNITMGALLAAITVMIQLSPLYLPLAGVSLSALATLPAALAGYLSVATGILTFLISATLVCCWSVPQAVIFLCSSGLLGLTLGIMLKKRLHYLIIACSGALVLTCGFLAVGKLLGIPVLPWLAGPKRYFLIPALFLCSFVYSVIWVPVLKTLFVRIEKHTALY